MSDSWRMSPEDAEEYTRALGQIMSGGWRQIALAQRLGVPEAIGMTTEAWVRERIGGYVRLGLDERREALMELTDPAGEYQLTQRQAAEVLGVDQATVSRALRVDASASPDNLLQPGGDDADDASASATAGDVADEIAAAWDDDAAAEEQARNQRLRAMRNTRIGWLRVVTEHPPGALVDGLALDELREVVRDLDRVIDWMQQARAVAAGARRPRRIEA